MIQLDTSTRAARMLSAGRVTVTFRSPSGQHITLRAKCRTTDDDGRWVASNLASAKVIFIEVPPASGGFGDRVARITRGKGFQPDPKAERTDSARVWCAKQLLRFLAGEPTAPGLECLEESACGRCGRALTDPVSIERGIGPECFGAMTGSQHQVKAPSGTATPPEWGGMAEAHYTQPRGDGKDAKGVPLAVGDWRARARRAKETLGGYDLGLKHPPGCQQMTGETPGETWEDMFRDRATEMGVVLPR